MAEASISDIKAVKNLIAEIENEKNNIKNLIANIENEKSSMKGYWKDERYTVAKTQISNICQNLLEALSTLDNLKTQMEEQLQILQN